jgi:hypothetical protein
LTLDKLAEHYRETFKQSGLGPHIDYIFVLDKGFLTLAIKPKGLEWAPVVLSGLGGPEGEGEFKRNPIT